MLGGPDISAIGFALGLNRLAEIIFLQKNNYYFDLYIVLISNIGLNLAFEWQMELSNIGIRVKTGDYSRSLKSQLRKANAYNVSYVLILGEREIRSNKVIFRCMKTKKQDIFLIKDVLTKVKNKIFKFKKLMD